MENYAAQAESKKVLDLKRGEIAHKKKPGLIDQINRMMANIVKRIDLTAIRILQFLFEEKGHTKAQIAKKLNLWEELIDEKLKWLKKQGFIYNRRINFGIDFLGNQRTICVYYIAELGRILLHYLDMQFSRLWMMTTNGLEAENCESSK